MTMAAGLSVVGAVPADASHCFVTASTPQLTVVLDHPEVRRNGVIDTNLSVSCSRSTRLISVTGTVQMDGAPAGPPGGSGATGQSFANGPAFADCIPPLHTWTAIAVGTARDDDHHQDTMSGNSPGSLSTYCTELRPLNLGPLPPP